MSPSILGALCNGPREDFSSFPAQAGVSAQVLAQEAPLLQEQEAAGDSVGRWLSPQSPADSPPPHALEPAAGS